MSGATRSGAATAPAGGDRRPLLEHLPSLRDRVPFTPLGVFPTPVEELSAIAPAIGGAPLYAKRDDRSSPVYGGNKVRTLEVLFGEALAAGCTRIYSTGAYGTNHGLAAVLHARHVGLESGVVLFPQPVSECALANLRALLGERPTIVDLPHWSALPFGMLATSRRDARERIASSIMMPGGATPTGGLGYVNAALELAEQVARGELPAPEVVVVGAGSNCTSAGLLVGFALAAKLGVGFVRPPRVRAVRVTPWPVTSKVRIVWLATEIARGLAELTGDASLDLGYAALAPWLEVDGHHLGWGYGFPTAEGRRWIATFHDALGFELDTTYSAKAVAGAVAAARSATGPVLYWSTKSTTPLPPVDEAAVAAAPPRMQRWMRSAERVLARRRDRGLLPP